MSEKDGMKLGMVVDDDGDGGDMPDLQDDQRIDRSWEHVTLPEGSLIQISVLGNDGEVSEFSNCRDVRELESALMGLNPGTVVKFQASFPGLQLNEGEVIIAGDIGVGIRHILHVGFGINLEEGGIDDNKSVGLVEEASVVTRENLRTVGEDTEE